MKTTKFECWSPSKHSATLFPIRVDSWDASSHSYIFVVTETLKDSVVETKIMKKLTRVRKFLRYRIITLHCLMHFGDLICHIVESKIKKTCFRPWSINIVRTSALNIIVTIEYPQSRPWCNDSLTNWAAEIERSMTLNSRSNLNRVATIRSRV